MTADVVLLLTDVHGDDEEEGSLASWRGGAVMTPCDTDTGSKMSVLSRETLVIVSNRIAPEWKLLLFLLRQNEMALH